MQIIIPSSTHILFFKSQLILIGSKTRYIFKSFGNLNRAYKLFILQNQIIIKNKISKPISLDFILLFKIFNHIKNKIFSLNNLYEKQLSIVGTGFRIWIKSVQNINVLLLKIGLSKDIFIKIPENIIILPIRSTLIRIIGIDKFIVSQFCGFLRANIKKDPYKGKGIYYANQNLILKTGKKN